MFDPDLILPEPAHDPAPVSAEAFYAEMTPPAPEVAPSEVLVQPATREKTDAEKAEVSRLVSPAVDLHDLANQLEPEVIEVAYAYDPLVNRGPDSRDVERANAEAALGRQLVAAGWAIITDGVDPVTGRRQAKITVTRAA